MFTCSLSNRTVFDASESVSNAKNTVEIHAALAVESIQTPLELSATTVCMNFA